MLLSIIIFGLNAIALAIPGFILNQVAINNDKETAISNAFKHTFPYLMDIIALLTIICTASAILLIFASFILKRLKNVDITEHLKKLTRLNMYNVCLTILALLIGVLALTKDMPTWTFFMSVAIVLPPVSAFVMIEYKDVIKAIIGLNKNGG
jgi:cytochrome bd-type quinol oxidase subunit 2